MTPIETDVPARLDRLPWGRFHWLFVSALGITWVLDGLEVTVVGAVGNALLEPETLGLRTEQLGASHTGYLVGAVTGALVFGRLTDRLGRKRLFTVTLLVYLAGAALTALAWDFWSFAFARLVTGLAIGGEYAAINSAIDELIPARVRGRVDLAVNGTFWLGAILGAGVSVFLLDPALVPLWLGWRLAFGLGAVAAVGMIVARQFVPESPRWLVTHGRVGEAEAIVRDIERRSVGAGPLPPAGPPITIVPGTQIGFRRIAGTLLVKYRSRAVLGLVLIASQAFFYNGMSFTYPLVLRERFGVALDRTGLFVLAMAVANLLGPVLLGPLFDIVGRRRMIAGTYAISAVVVAVGSVLFARGELTAVTQTALWAGAFFFASAAASAGYLTVSEIFPVEMRAMAIALFYAVGTAVGGALAPLLFGYLLKTGSPWVLACGYWLGAGLMLAAAVAESVLGIDAERRGLEEIAEPLSAAPAPT
ncbi:MAG: MFS transporter [Planctomycetes bacterium]|nr:MFS transporter [Planctomycetota bacterium]